MAIRLSQSALGALPACVSKPRYDRSALTPGILHIGVGNFHRAHQAVYLDKLFNMGVDHDWAIVGAGVRAGDATMRDNLQMQDWLTTIVELDPDGLTARVCGPMIDFVTVDPAILIDALTKPEIRIVSLTITEGGYFVDAQSGGFDTTHPEISRDIQHPDQPLTVFGILVAALARRRDLGIPAFTIMSCDNLPENGTVAGDAVIGLAQAISPSLGEWIATNVAFPNGMVDCITPATSARERQLVADKFGIDDASPVVCEPFRQWVLEDKFPSGRPALERVGVEFVTDVAPYELMKLRILNGGHAAIAYPSALLGIQYVHEAMAHPLIRGFLRKLVMREIMPTVPEIPGVNFTDYFESVVERFSNPAIGDTIPRLCLDGSNRQPKFILPTIFDRLAKDQPVDGLALEVALWCRYCEGKDENGDAIILDDENADVLQKHAGLTRSDPGSFLGLNTIFGTLGEDQAFKQAFCDACNLIRTSGTEASLRRYIDG